MIVGRPARELAPFDRLELAAREFQRPFSQCAGGRDTDNRAKQARDDDASRRFRKLPTSLHANKCTADRNGSATRATISLGAVERLCCAGTRYCDADKDRNGLSATFQQEVFATTTRHSGNVSVQPTLRRSHGERLWMKSEWPACLDWR